MFLLISSVLLALLVVYLTHHYVISPMFSPLRNLPTAKRTSVLFGNIPDLINRACGEPFEEWIALDTEQIGVVRFFGVFSSERLVITDPVALKHILLTNSYDFPKPNALVRELKPLAGDGILLAEGERHKRQRRIMNPSFAPSHLALLVPIFFASARKLKEKWVTIIDSSSGIDATAFRDTADDPKKLKFAQERKKGSSAAIDTTVWYRKVTLDVIGLAGFGYDLGAMSDGKNALRESLGELLDGEVRRLPMPLLVLLGICFYLIDVFPRIEPFLPLHHLKKVRHSINSLDVETAAIIERKKKELATEGGSNERDLITLLMKSIGPDAKSPLSNSELRGQIKTFILAGHETTAGALGWLSLSLAQNQEVQSKLRDEVTAAMGDDGELDMDTLMGLPYLDAVCRETLRLDPPVAGTLRRSTSASTSYLPLSNSRTVTLPPNQLFHIPISYLNKSKEVWGEDADMFRPERWLEGKEGMGNTLGVWSGLLTFLEGPRSCPGYKFAILELKAIIATLIIDFKFDEREPGLKIHKKEPVIPRPLVDGEEEMGNRLPLKISLVERER